MRRALARRGYADAKPLKRGATGRVYEATRRDDGARCALKMLATRDARDEDATTATTREADALRRCGGHANVIALREAWIDDARGVGWIAMEHGGGDLTTRAATAARAANYAAQIGMALRHVHERCGMVHGDVKPENVLVDEDGMVRLGDFGSARAERRRRAGAGGRHAVVRAAGGVLGRRARVLDGGRHVGVGVRHVPARRGRAAVRRR